MEWLSTGEMIDRLKVGEIAISENNYTKVIRNRVGGIGHEDDPMSNLKLNSHNIKLKWRILPNYVSWDEAYEALQEGKEISMYNDHIKGQMKKFNKHDCIQHLHGIGLSFDQWFNGKWVIEEDSQ